MDRRTALKMIAAATAATAIPAATPSAMKFGWQYNKHSLDNFIRRHRYPYFSQQNQLIKGTGKGKKAFLHKALEQVMGEKLTPHKQEAPDCFYAGTLVTMSDGSQKPIEKVRSGERVISHTGKSRKVIDTIRKPYEGKLITVETPVSRLVCTPDHLFWTTEGWKQAKDLKLSDSLHITPQRNKASETFDILDYIPDAEATHDKIRAKGSSKWVNRFIPLNEDFAYILGVYLAEGSHKKHSIMFNLAREEEELANALNDKILRVFGIECTTPIGPSKPTVQIVSCDSKAVSELVTSLCPGTTYTKQTPAKIQVAPDNVKKAFILGWLEGDGCCNGRKNRNWGRHFGLLGTSVSLSLVRGMCRLLSSLGIAHTVTHQHPEDRAKAYKINIRSKSIFELYPELKNEAELRHPNLKPFNFQEFGATTKILKLSNVSKACTTVYCLVVEEDHSFSADLISVHNCVSQAAALGVDVLSAVQIVRGEPQRWVTKAATEPIYGGSRIEVGDYRGMGGGSTGHWAAEWLTSYGVLLRQKYPGWDFSEYDPQLAKQLGREGCPDELEPVAKLHPVKKAAICTSYSDLCDCLYNGSPVMVCSNVGFGDSSDSWIRDSEGFLTRDRRPWYHAMLFLGYDDEYRRPGALCMNSWGYWVKGPTRGSQPSGSFWIDASTVDAMLSQGDSFAFSAFKGFPRVVIPPYILH
jgi:intein/homing endonuclease